MIIKAVMENSQHPEYGEMSIPFPIPNDQYDEIMEMLEKLEIGDALKRDCHVNEVRGDYLILKRLENQSVNIDELDYLAKRLDSFDEYEKTQFQGMAARLDLCCMDELINLTFCCQEVTVVTDFNDLKALGCRHYLTLGNGASLDEMHGMDFRKVALAMLEGEVGRVTPYGVVYDNGFEMVELYKMRIFPEYSYEASLLEVEISSLSKPETEENLSHFLLPMTQAQIERTMLRGGVDGYEDMRLRFQGSCLPTEVDVCLDMEHEGLHDLNEMCAAIAKLDQGAYAKLGAAVELAKPEYSSQVRQLAENLDLFEFVPKVHTPEELGKYIIMQSGHFEYDENLAGYIDFAKYGADRLERDSGVFTDRGYISFNGTMSLDELMQEKPAEQGFQMGGQE